MTREGIVVPGEAGPPILHRLSWAPRSIDYVNLQCDAARAQKRSVAMKQAQATLSRRWLGDVH